MSGDDQWGVVVDEGKINATGRGANWWAEVSTRMALNDVLVTLDTAAIIGGTEFMRCDSREDAEFAAGHISEHTLPQAVKVATLHAARKSVEAKHAKRSDHGGCEYCRDDKRSAA